MLSDAYYYIFSTSFSVNRDMSGPMLLLNSDIPSLVAQAVGSLTDCAIPVLRSPVGVEQAFDSVPPSHCPLKREHLQQSWRTYLGSVWRVVVSGTFKIICTSRPIDDVVDNIGNQRREDGRVGKCLRGGVANLISIQRHAQISIGTDDTERHEEGIVLVLAAKAFLLPSFDP